MFTSFKRIIRWGWIGFKRQLGISLATCFILVMTTSLVGALFIYQKASDFLIVSLQKKMDLAIYFVEESTQEDILNAKEELSNLSEIEQIEFISKEEALEKFVQRHGDNPTLMESLVEVGGNPFLASLNIKAKDPLQYDNILNFLDTAPFKEKIAKIDYQQKKPIIERISVLTSQINKTGLIISVILGILACLIVFNQVRMAILNSKQEIEMMRLVGASNWFIRGPFLVQSLICGILSVLITFSIFSVVIFFLNSKVELITSGFSLSENFFGNFLQIILIQVLVGIGLPIFLSFVAIKKYLKI